MQYRISALVLLTAACGELPGEATCDPACAPWQRCNGTTCELTPGRCVTDADCLAGCDTEDHVCVATCEPPCASWQICLVETCEPRDGACADDTDCPPETPTCSPARTCVEEIIDFELPVVLAYQAVIVTSEALRASFDRLATLHTVTGTATELITVEAICGGACNDADPTSDSARALKEYLRTRSGIEFILLGGDLEHVPSRSVYDEYDNPLDGSTFREDFFTDYYFADLSVWDGNGDGVYADDGTDFPDLRPELGVARLPVSTVAEAELAIDKITHHLTAYAVERIDTAVLISNVATNLIVDIDGGLYFEAAGATVDRIPSHVAIDKLYAGGATTALDAETLTVERQLAAMEAGYNLVVHNGHGSEAILSIDYAGSNGVTASHCYDLTNADYPFVLSCSCSAGAFDASDSAGENLLNAPAGGAIGYLGNTATGLGLAGGAQLIDEFITAAYASRNPRVGDVLRSAHATFDYPAGMVFPVVGHLDTVDLHSYEWTHKATVYFGDPMVPIWNDATLTRAPAVTVAHAPLAGGTEVSIGFAAPVTGTLRLSTGANVYETALDRASAVDLAIAEDPTELAVGLATASSLPAFRLH